MNTGWPRPGSAGCGCVSRCSLLYRVMGAAFIKARLKRPVDVGIIRAGKAVSALDAICTMLSPRASSIRNRQRLRSIRLSAFPAMPATADPPRCAWSRFVT